MYRTLCNSCTRQNKYAPFPAPRYPDYLQNNSPPWEGQDVPRRIVVRPGIQPHESAAAWRPCRNAENLRVC